MVPKVSNISQMLHTIPSIDNPMCYSFDTIDIKSICDKIKTQIETLRWTFIFVNHSPNECNKRKLLILIKSSIACSCISHKDNCCKKGCIHSLVHGIL